MTGTIKAETWLPVLREALESEGRTSLPLRGRSMLPSLPSVCTIDLEPLPTHVPRGAIIVFALGEGLVAHRLVDRAGELLIAQGDNLRAPDPPLRRDQVLGVVTGASIGGRRCWPRRGERWRAVIWLTRARLLLAARSVLRSLRSAGQRRT